VNRILARLGQRLPERWFEAGLDLLFPPRCAGCGRIGEVWCSDCNNDLRRLTGRLCVLCGLPIRVGRLCRACNERAFPLTVRSYARYEGALVHALLQLKYYPNRRLASVMAQWLAEICRRERWQIDMIVPVPLGRNRLRQRGYNQAGLIASAMVPLLQSTYGERALWRVRETRSQVGLDAGARMENVQGAFRADREVVQGQTILLVDDLITTGATLFSCGMALLEADAKMVRGVSVARALGEYPV
jgi:ComF family protein